MAKKLRIKRGLKRDLPNLDIGELGLTTDEAKVYVGSVNGNEGLVTDKELTLVNGKVDTVTTQLDQKANKSEVTTIANQLEEKANLSYVESKFGNMGNTKTFKGACLFSELPSESTVDDYWYVTDESTNYCWNGLIWVEIGNSLNIGESSISPSNTNFFNVKKSKNLFNPNYTRSSNTSDDAIILGSDNPLVKINAANSFSNDAGLFLSNYIKVKSNTQYTFYSIGGGNINVRTFNTTKGIVASNAVNTTDGNLTFTTGENVEYIRFNCAISRINTVMFNEGVKVDFESYYDPIYFLSSEYLDEIREEQLKDEIITTPKIKEKTITFNKTDFMNFKNVNLLNVNPPNLMINKQFAGNGTIQDQNNWRIFDYIEVNDTDSFVVSAFKIFGSSLWGYYQVYDANKNVLTSRARFDINVPFTLATGAKYIRLNFIPSATVGDVIFAKGTSRVPYVKYGYNIPNLIVERDNFTSDYYKWYGKKFCAYGDSNTGNRMWQEPVVNKFGLVYSHLGKGGTTAPGRSVDTELQEIPLDTDVITIMFGTNDWSQNIPVGEDLPVNIPDNYTFDTTTFTGALGKMVAYVAKNIPNARIILMSPPFRTSSVWNDAVATETTRNGSGSSIVDYGTAVQKIARKFGCDYIDTYHEMGVNVYNFKNFLLNETYPVHFNENGGKRLAQLVSERLRKMEPLV